jgi:hypothetical protein
MDAEKFSENAKAETPLVFPQIFSLILIYYITFISESRVRDTQKKIKFQTR